jgi:hypothetical protein
MVQMKKRTPAANTAPLRQPSRHNTFLQLKALGMTWVLDKLCQIKNEK